MKDALVYALVALAREVLWWLTRPQPAPGAEPDPDQSRYTRTWDELEAFADSPMAGGFAGRAVTAAGRGDAERAANGVQGVGNALALGTESRVNRLGSVVRDAMLVDLQFASKVVDLIEAEFVESEHA